MSNLDKKELLQTILEDVEEEMTDEEIMHLILSRRISKDTRKAEKYTFGEKAADVLAKFVGSWAFVLSFSLFLLFWIFVNNSGGKTAFDPFPFILLNLMLSCLAAIQAPLIMMSQNRQEKKDRKRAENDYAVNLKTEIIIQDIHSKLDQILKQLEDNKLDNK